MIVAYCGSVILEGPECCGKSTAAKQLVAAGYSLRHEGPAPDDVEHLPTYYKGVFLTHPKPMVWDRSIIGELVYGPILRGHSRVHVEEVIDFVHWFRREGGSTFLLLPDFTQLHVNFLTRHAEKPKPQIIHDNLKAIYGAYKLLLECAPMLFDGVVAGYCNDWRNNDKR